MMGCRHAVVDEGPAHRWGHRWQRPGGRAERWDVIKQGIKIDVDSGKQKGEQTPEEFWSRVWDDMKDTHKTPDGTVDGTTTTTTTTTTSEKTEEPGVHVPTAEMMKEVPRPLTWMMLMRRWEEIGKGTEPDKVSIDTWEEVKAFHKKHLNKEATAKLEEMTQSGKDDEFWSQHWQQRKEMERRRHAHGDHRNWWYSNSSNTKDSHGCRGMGQHGHNNKYPLGYNPETSEFTPYGPCRFSSLRRKPADERQFYKEFDFCS